MPPRSRPAPRPAGRCSASASVIPGKGHDVLLDALATITDLVLAVPVRRQTRPRPGVRRGRHSPRPEHRAGRPGAVPGCLHRGRARPQLRRRRPAGAGVARRDVWHGRHRGACPRAAGRRRPRSGGVPEALGHGTGGTRPGLLVPPGDPGALAAALRAWLGDAGLRHGCAGRHGERRASLSGWPATPPLRRTPGASGAMTVEGIRVSSEWLDLREPADADARALDLVEHLRRHLPATGRRVIHDLGCGTGAMGRWLAPLLPGPQHWVVHDRDAELLDRRRRPSRPGRRRRRGRRGGAATDITRLAPDDLAGAGLITASALLDLMTGDQLAGWSTSAPAPDARLLLTLSVTAASSWRRGSARRRRGGRLRRPPARVAGGGRLLGPDAAGGRCGGVPPAAAPRCWCGQARGGWGRPRPDWRRSGWRAGRAPRASRRRSWRPGRRLRRPASARGTSRAAGGTVGHADLLVMP